MVCHRYCPWRYIATAHAHYPVCLKKVCLTVKGTFSFKQSEAEILIVCRSAFLTLVGKINFCCSSKLEVKDEVVLNQSDCNRAI